MDINEVVKNRTAEHYAWPGAYPIVYVCNDGEVLCPDCVNDPTNPVHTILDLEDGWQVIGWDVIYESPAHCSHCNKVIESAYGKVV